MIVREFPDHWQCVGQIEHAEQSGRLAAQWGNERFARPVGFDALVDACGRHDEAWRTLDASPRVTESGEPCSFLEMPLEPLLRAYQDGAERVACDNPFAGFFVAMHYQGFFNGRFGLDASLPSKHLHDSERELVTAFHSAMNMARGRYRSQAFERQRLHAGWPGEAATQHGYLLLQVVDGISLFLCLSGTTERSLGVVPRTSGGPAVELTLLPTSEPDVVRVDPWPFALGKPVVLDFPVRRLEKRRYRDDLDLRDAMASARSEKVTMTVVGGVP